MFARMLAWLSRLPGEADLSVHLAHAKSALDERFAQLLREAPPVAAIDLDGADSVVNAVRMCAAARRS